MRFFFYILLVFSSSQIGAATFTAADGTWAGVSNALYLASNGDTVVIPIGTNEWSSSLSVTKAVTIQGQGTNSTCIQDNVPDSGTWQNQSIFSVSAVANYTTRITGINFIPGTRATVSGAGIIFFAGSNTNGGRGIVDNCRFGNVRARCGIFVYGVLGVSYSNTFLLNATGRFAFDVRHPNWDGSSNGDGAWADSAQFGTDKFWFIEDSIIARTGTLYEMIDTYGGGKWVIRHCTITNGRWATHGTDSSERQRGTRAIEAYNNVMTGDGVNGAALTLRSGAALVYSNAITGWATAFPQGVFGLYAYRMQCSVLVWTGAAGTNIWDNNSTGGTAGVFESGTATSPATTTTRLFGDSSKSWTANQWSGYTLRNLTTGRFCEISTNGTTNVFYKLDIFYQTIGNMEFDIGDSYEIRKVLNVLDQPGVGAGDLLNTSFPAWPNQVVEPCYEWSNTVNTTLNGGMSGNNGVIVENTHYFNDTAMPGYAAYTYPHPLRGAVIADSPIVRVNNRGRGFLSFP